MAALVIRGALCRHVHCIASRWWPKIGPAGVVSPFFLRHAGVVASAPGGRDKPPAVPRRLDPRAVPGAAVVQNKNQSALMSEARPLHDIKVVIDEDQSRRT